MSLRLQHAQRRLRQLSLPAKEMNQQKIERTQFEPKIPNWLTDEQKKKQNQHARVGHQQTPLFQRGSGQFSITFPEPAGAPAAGKSPERVAQIFQTRRNQFLLAGKTQIQSEQKFFPQSAAPGAALQFQPQLCRRIKAAAQ